MERHIKVRWDDEKREQIASRFGIQADDLTALDGFESFIYEYQREGSGYILRVGHSHRRNPKLIHAEADWLNYLAEGGARVAQAIQSENGELVEVIDDGHGEQFLAMAFVKASGSHLGHEHWTSEFLQHYGAVLGKIHHLSKTYQPSKPEWQRAHWADQTDMEFAGWLKVADPAIIAKIEPIIQQLKALPKDQTYHMIHQDAHGGNFYVDDGQITLFDFDDCIFGHEIYDIAMCIFYGPTLQNPDLAETFTTHFLTGYARENQLDPKWLAQIAAFMKLREIDLYIMIERDIDWRNGEDPWAGRFMQGRRERILKDLPITSFDFSKLSVLLK